MINLCYAGTIDWIYRRKRTHSKTGVLDIKTGKPQPQHAYQVGLYAHAIKADCAKLLYIDPLDPSEDGFKEVDVDVFWSDNPEANMGSRQQMRLLEIASRAIRPQQTNLVHGYVDHIFDEDFALRKGVHIKFLEDTHEYVVSWKDPDEDRLQMFRLPSVNQLLEQAGIAKKFRANSFISKEDYVKYAQIGTSIHKWIEWHEKTGEELPSELDEAYHNSIKQWEGWKKSRPNLELVSSETVTASYINLYQVVKGI
tara:strand:+ start:624 stop:1385 length:762 start_codon:yes stop_codon:yes gene_type:complete